MEIKLSALEDVATSFIKVLDFKGDLVIDESASSHDFHKFVRANPDLTVAEIKAEGSTLKVSLWQLKEDITHE